MLTLPDDLRRAIERALSTVPAPSWLHAAQELSERYRGARPANAQPLAAGAREALGYAALIMPATYAQLRGALAATAARIPTWAPTTMLDLGSGPGTALWAASAQWPALRALSAFEREPALIALGRDLARESAAAALRSARWKRADLRQATIAGTYDLVVLGHVLNELDPDTRRPIVAAAWAATAGVLVIVEPGTAPAFEVVRAARDELLAAGALTLAPCAHDRPCPLENDWCHFPQRLQRPEFQRRARQAPSPWEDSKFAYAAMARFAPEAPIWGRVIREPTSNKAYAEAELSTRDGILRYRALKRHREDFRRVKDLTWGQALSEPLREEPNIPAED
jgi:ribosomal protein RSM22 (predicted rRNA methylase)